MFVLLFKVFVVVGAKIIWNYCAGMIWCISESIRIVGLFCSLPATNAVFAFLWLTFFNLSPILWYSDCCILVTDDWTAGHSTKSIVSSLPMELSLSKLLKESDFGEVWFAYLSKNKFDRADIPFKTFEFSNPASHCTILSSIYFVFAVAGVSGFD